MSQLVSYFLSQDLLVSPDFLSYEVDHDAFLSTLKKYTSELPLVITHDIYLIFSYTQKDVTVDWFAFDSSRVAFERGVDIVLYSSFLELLDFYMSEDQKMILSSLDEVHEPSPVVIAPDVIERRVVPFSYITPPTSKKTVSDFVGHFRARYEALKKILIGRTELAGTVSISRLAHKPERESVSLIGCIVEKNETKNGNIILTLEDPSGRMKVLLSHSKSELYDLGRDLVLDEVIGVTGVLGNQIVFCNTVLLPDVPVNHEIKKAPDEAYALFITDIHLGSTLFFEKEFVTFISWLRGEYGTVRQRAIASRVRYLFICGDLVEGVGVYPGQEKDLSLSDVREQYASLSTYLSQIPPSITIIACGGNHDAMRIAEPQPLFDMEYCSSLFTLPHLVMVSNPAVVTIHASEGFSGFQVLMYHGYSFPFYADTVPSLVAAGGLRCGDLIMKFLLQCRHLAPTHTSSLYLPDSSVDPLVISEVPDFFISGHTHFLSTSQYRQVTLINPGCWCGQSENQAKRGMIPNPGKVVLCNLQTRDVRVMDFLQHD